CSDNQNSTDKSSFEHPIDWQRIASSGFSDSLIFQLKLFGVSFAVRSWPNTQASVDKVAFWDRLQRSDVFRPFPKLVPWIGYSQEQILLFPWDGKLWSLSEWIDGRPFQESDLSLERVGELASVLAKIHAATLESSVPEASGPSRTLVERANFLGRISRRWEASVMASDFFQRQGLVAPLIQCLATIDACKKPWGEQLEQISRADRRYHWIVRDLWYENVLVRPSGEFASIVDLGASRFDWPGLDFIRLFGSITGLANNQSCGRVSTKDWWEKAYSVYTSGHPNHALGSVTECIDLNEIATALSLAQWIEWIENRTIQLSSVEDENRVARRIRQLCQAAAWLP
ncbi:MAG: phosphotransferase, partial [Pirellula sp.]